MNKWFIALMSLAFIGGSFFLKTKAFTPSVETPLPSPQLSLTKLDQDLSESFKLEYRLASSCLYDYNLASTLYGFKKAKLVASSLKEKSQATYGLIYTYFLAKKFQDLKSLYLSEALEDLDPEAPYFQDAMIIFYIAFKELKIPFVSSELEKLLMKNDALKIALSQYHNILTLNLSNSLFEAQHQNFLKHTKSAKLAATLNLVIPGSGYLYLHQKQSALTCFALLMCLGFALYLSTRQKQIAASLVLFSVFTGYYWGSIVGVKEAATFYNQTAFDYYFQPVLEKEKLYPELRIQYAP